MALLDESGEKVVVDTHLLSAAPVLGGMVAVDASLQSSETVPAALVSVPPGILALTSNIQRGGIVSNSPVSIGSDELRLPGYALRKTARVLTLQSEKRVALRTTIG